MTIEKLVLLTSEQDIEARVAFEPLVNYVEQLEAGLLNLAADSSDHGRVWLQVEIQPDGPPVHKLAYDGSISTDLLQAYYEHIRENADAPEVCGPVSFQLIMIVRDLSSPLSDGATE